MGAFSQEPYYHEDKITMNQAFYMNRYGRSHLYVQTNTSNNVILEAGDYQTINIPPKQWVYWPYPETFPIKLVLPLYGVTIASFATDDVIGQLGRYGEGYNDYARIQQAFHASVSGAATATHYIAIELGTPNNNQANAVIDRVTVDMVTLSTFITVIQNTIHDANLVDMASVNNHRIDAGSPGNNVTPISTVMYSTDTTTVPSGGNVVQDVATTPGQYQIDIFGSNSSIIRQIPKLYEGYIGIYVQSASASTFNTINLDWHEEQ